MYKCKLQELCQRHHWELPEYTTVRDGPDHMPRFTATVSVHGQLFETPAKCKSAKDAQNTAARIAFNHCNAPPPPPQSDPPPPPAVDPPQASIVAAPAVAPPAVDAIEMQAVPIPPLLPLSPLPSSLPIPPPALLATRNANTRPAANGEVLQQNTEDSVQTSMVYRIATDSHDKHFKETVHMYKNQLQQYAQKKNLGLPTYATEGEGPPHARRFKSRVSLDGKSYETLEFFPTLKEAEQAAAKIACQVLSVDVIVEDGGLYKNLLQELAQKKGFLCPSYETVRLGLSHRSSFLSTVEIGSHTFKGAEAKTKKQAEMNAAKAAYRALTAERDQATEYSRVSSISECSVDSSSQNVQPIATTKKHQDAADKDCSPEAHVQAKRAKSSPENKIVNTHLTGPSHSSSLSDDANSHHEPVKVQPADEEPRLRKTIIYPRSSTWSVPKNAIMLPHSDNQWVAYEVDIDFDPTANS